MWLREMRQGLQGEGINFISSGKNQARSSCMHVYTKDMHVREIPVVKSGGGGGWKPKESMCNLGTSPGGPQDQRTRLPN